MYTACWYYYQKPILYFIFDDGDDDDDDDGGGDDINFKTNRIIRVGLTYPGSFLNLLQARLLKHA